VAHSVHELCVVVCVFTHQIEQARLVQQYCDKADTCLAKSDYRTVSKLNTGWPLVWKTWKYQGNWNMSGKKSCQGKVSQNCSLL